MAQLIIVNSTQVKAFRNRFQALLAKEPTEHARLREIEARPAAEWEQMQKAQAGDRPESEVES